MAASPVPARTHPSPAPGPGAESVPEISVDLVAVTRDDALLEQIGQELDGQTGIRLADSVEVAGEHVVATHAQVFLLDARDHADLAGAVDRLQSYSDSAVVVVFVPESQLPETAAAIRRTAVFAVLTIPVEPGKTAAVLEGAREEALSRATLAIPQAGLAQVTSQSVELPSLDVEPWSEPAAVAPPARPRTSKWLVPGLVGLVLLGIAAGWYLLDRPTPRVEPESAIATEAADAAAAPIPAAGTGVADPRRSAAPVAAKSTPRRVVAGSVEVLLDKADTAFRDRRYVEPETDSALLYYQSVLAQAPDNGEARQGVERIVAVLDQRLQSAVAERRFDDAGTALAQLERVRPSDPKIQSIETRILEGQIAEALEAGKFDRANQVLRQATQAQALPADRATYWRDEIGREISRRQRAQQAAIAQQQAAEEVRPSAEMRAPAATPGKRVDAAQQAPAFGEMTETPPSSEPGRQTAARQSAAEAARVDPVGPGPAAARQALPASAAPAPVPEPRQSAALERTYYVAPAYPRSAEKQGLSGEVRVQLTVGTNGRVKAAEVVSSTPVGVFDQSVMAAVIRWRFKPPQVEGRPVETTTVVSVVFKPADGARR